MLAPSLFIISIYSSQLSVKQDTKGEIELYRSVSSRNNKSAMSLKKSQVEYVLTRSDAGVPPYRILNDLQYREYLPGINIATIERCLCENGRPLVNYEPGNAAQGSPSPGVDRASNRPSPANQGTPSPSTTQGTPSPSATQSTPSPCATIQVAIQSPGSSPIVQSIETDEPVNPVAILPWDDRADDFAISAYESGRSEDDICSMLRDIGYDITRVDVILSLIRQGVQIVR